MMINEDTRSRAIKELRRKNEISGDEWTGYYYGSKKDPKDQLIFELKVRYKEIKYKILLYIGVAIFLTGGILTGVDF